MSGFSQARREATLASLALLRRPRTVLGWGAGQVSRSGKTMKIFVTGACGYKGSVLVPKLLKAGHKVVAFDVMWFSNFLEPHPDLTVVKADVRNPDEIDLTGVHAIIRLSSAANDPCGDLDPNLTWYI